MTDRELLQEVLEVMESLHRTGDTQVFDLCAAPILIPALRAALARPEQEPIAWVTGWHDGHCVIRAVDPALMLPIGAALYTAPPRQWQGLTDEDKQTAVWTDGTFGAGALWAEAKLREKNT